MASAVDGAGGWNPRCATYAASEPHGAAGVRTVRFRMLEPHVVEEGSGGDGGRSENQNHADPPTG